MGFTLGVENAPSRATQWGCYCNSDTTLQPNSVQEQPTKPYGLLPLDEKWISLDPAPGENQIDIGCFDPGEYTVKETIVSVTILEGKDYIFDFATETLREAIPAVSFLPLLAIIGGLGILGMGIAAIGLSARPRK